jgi:GT2 family glycosyltransferase
MSTKFTIGIVTFNNLFYSKLQLKKIREHTYPYTYDILVYDNGSTDGTSVLGEPPGFL